MNGPLASVRSDRGAPAPRSLTAVSRGAAETDDDISDAQKSQLAVQHAAFDFDVAERAELLREHAALQALMLEELKNDDEIMKKFIALI